jgi:hypothetical protein
MKLKLAGTSSSTTKKAAKKKRNIRLNVEHYNFEARICGKQWRRPSQKVSQGMQEGGDNATLFSAKKA